MVIKIRRGFLYCFFEERRGDGERAVVKICPAQGVGGIRKIGSAAARGLRQGEGHVYAAAMFEQKVSKIICSERFVGLEAEGFLISSLRLLPVSLALVEA